jgi:hypothetical protein
MSLELCTIKFLGYIIEGELHPKYLKVICLNTIGAEEERKRGREEERCVRLR